MPPPGDERTTERRLVPSTSQHSMAAESTRDVAQEDFLFHLYRGSELLQENRILEAKEELEFALTVQPSDPKGQDLLGAVYFRLGLYPRAIQIYEALEHGFPNDASIKVNVALAYLKTGQPVPARRVLTDATRLNPEHKRAWGYLGLALQKLGELDQAQIAFERGGHELMARRVTEKPAAASRSRPADGAPGSTRACARRQRRRSRSSTRGSSASRSPSPRDQAPDSTWHTRSLAKRPRVPRGARSPRLRPAIGRRLRRSTSSPPSPRRRPPSRLPPCPRGWYPSAPRAPPPCLPPVSHPIQARERHVAPSLLAHAADAPVVLHARGVLLVTTTEDRAFAAKLEPIRVVTGTTSTRVLHRRARDAETSEVLGSIGSPVIRVSGNAQLVLGGRAGHTLLPLAMTDDLAFVREEYLLGFELSLAYENGRLALDRPARARAPRTRAPTSCSSAAPGRWCSSFRASWRASLASRASPCSCAASGSRAGSAAW